MVFLPEGMNREMQLWDEIAKKIVFVMPGMLLPLIQEIYKKEYPNDAEIRPLATEYSVERKGPDEISHLYKVPTMKVQTFTLQEIKEKHLTFLIPFVPLMTRLW